MQAKHLPLLVCPATGRPLEIRADETAPDGRIRTGTLIEPIDGHEYPIVEYIPRFVPRENYASGFGFQWKTHRRTQYDLESGVSTSKDRFERETKWGTAGDLSGELILEAGSGSGRFTPHALATGATVVSFDYSDAVEANYASNGTHPELLLVQADIYQMPLRDEFFDKVYCFGVLQHTPDPHCSFQELIKRLKPGGKLASDVYLKSPLMYLHAKAWGRPLVRNMPPQKLYRLVQRYVDFWWPLAKLLRKSWWGQKAISRLIADRSDYLTGVDDATLKEWAYLDTFDWFSPAYDNPQTLKTFRDWHDEAGLADIEVHRGFNGCEGRGTKPAQAPALQRAA